MVYHNNKRVNLGTHSEEMVAAKIYDIALIQEKGLNALVNLSYSKASLLAILFVKSLIVIKQEYDEHVNQYN